MSRELRDRVLHHFAEGSARRALTVDGGTYDYGTLGEVAHDVARALVARCGDLTGRRVGIYADNTVVAYAALLATVELDATYVPLDPRSPVTRTAEIVEQVGLSVVVADPRSVGRAGDVAGIGPVFEPTTDVWVGGDAPISAATLDPPPRYVLFTSGSTGSPKGIAIGDRSILAMMGTMAKVAPILETDRVAQAFDLTFDLAQYSTLATWIAGAEVVAMSETDRLAPVEFVQRHLISYWFSVPSVARLAEESEAFRDGALSTVRMSLFCGEGLPHALATSWMRATAGSPVLNLYGPTEATIACSYWRVSPDDRLAPNGLVPLGVPFDGTRFALLTGEGLPRSPAPGVEGELLIAGDQVFDGYLGDPEKTASAFLESGGERWYRSGDRVEVDDTARLIFKGRLDEQVQLRGLRVEPREIEFRLARELGVRRGDVVVVPLTDAHGLVARLGAALADPRLSESRVREGISRCLPRHLAPSLVRLFPEFPLNANGKVDRAAVRAAFTGE